MEKSLKYYSIDGTLTDYSKYTINTSGVVKSKKTGRVLGTFKNASEYNTTGVSDDNGKRRGILIGRAVASTFIGAPPTIQHTADHENGNRDDDTIENIRWLDEPGQKKNRTMPATYKAAFVIVKDGIEKTNKGWVEYLKDKKNHKNRYYTEAMITSYAQRKRHGFSYKEYQDLPEEIWKEIIGSKTKLGRWEISDMNRVKYITNHAENVLSGERLGLIKGYPVISFGGKNWPCHILSLMSFFPEEYAAKKPGEIVLHENDDKLDFRPHKLNHGTHSKNRSDAHDNGCYDGTKVQRNECASYIKGVFEKNHESQEDAAAYLKTCGYDAATPGNIGRAISGDRKIAYKRTWKLICFDNEMIGDQNALPYHEQTRL